MSGWQLVDNSAHAYERHLVPAIMAPFADELAEPVSPGERVLDVACGTGIVARRAAARGADATGVDLNAQMLEVARAAEPAIEWIEADAADLPLPDNTFDRVFCHQGLQFFADPSAAIREMRRVLAPGGRLAVSVWRPSHVYERLAALLDAESAAIMRSPFAGPDAEALRALGLVLVLATTLALAVVTTSTHVKSPTKLWYRVTINYSGTERASGVSAPEVPLHGGVEERRRPAPRNRRAAPARPPRGHVQDPARPSPDRARHEVVLRP
jgi:SAM-dependent methyltransferase